MSGDAWLHHANIRLEPSSERTRPAPCNLPCTNFQPALPWLLTHTRTCLAVCAPFPQEQAPFGLPRHDDVQRDRPRVPVPASRRRARHAHRGPHHYHFHFQSHRNSQGVCRPTSMHSPPHLSCCDITRRLPPPACYSQVLGATSACTCLSTPSTLPSANFTIMLLKSGVPLQNSFTVLRCSIGTAACYVYRLSSPCQAGIPGRCITTPDPTLNTGLFAVTPPLGIK